MNIYVGNLPYDITEEELQEAFATHGQVESARIIKDTYSGKSRGFGFVEMPAKSEGQSAISNLDGAVLKGRTLKVSEARPRSEGRRGGRGRGGGRHSY
jgi:RNA recognition motif-containing protein